MTDAVEQIALLTSPLDDKHTRLGATMIERDGWRVPANYGDVTREYSAVRDGQAGLIDLSSRGRILVTGSEAVQFLNGLITNDMKTLETGRWMPAAFPNVQGRLLAAVRVIHQAETDKNVCPTFLIDTEAATHDHALKIIERFTLAGDFHVSDITGATAQITVQGKQAAAIVGSALGNEAAQLPENGAIQASWQGSDVTIIKCTHTGEDGFDLIAESEQAESLWDSLQSAGPRPVGHDALEILRIEAGIPRYGIDVDDSNVVTEALDEAVSYTKGCYVGQEIIARIKYRGHVAKKLTGISFEKEINLEAGATIKSSDHKDIGRITSATFSPRLQRTIALGYVKFDHLGPGTVIKVTSAGVDVPALTTELPFVRGSWYK